MKQNTAEWLAWRNCGIGASDAAAILGVSPWKTAYQLWCEKTGRTQPLKMNAAMARGKELEPIARAAYEQQTGLVMQPGTFEHPEWPVMRCSVDGITLDGDCVYEGKAPGTSDHAIALGKGIPPHYVPQCQHILAVTLARVLHYFSYCPGWATPTALVEVFPSSAYIAELMEAERAFWKCVVDDTPPPFTERDVIERTDGAWLSAAEEYRCSEAAAAEWSAKKEAARQLLDSLAGEAVRVAGGGITLTRYFAEGRVDYSRVPELRGVDLAPYRKKGKAQFRITVGKED